MIVRRIFSLVIVALVILGISPKTLAISEIQKNLFNQGIYYYNYDSNSSSNCSSNESSVAPTSAASVASFVDSYGQAAFNSGKQYGIPYEIILAQGILESGYAKSQLASVNFNFFGLRAYPGWTGATVTYNTNIGEVKYESFPNAEVGFNGYGEFITNGPRYANALQSTTAHNPLAYLTDIVHDGYNSSDPATWQGYIDTVWSIEQGVVAYINSTNPPKFPPSSQVVYNANSPADVSVSSDCSLSGGGLANVVNIANQEYNLNPKPYGNEPSNCNANMLKYTNGVCYAWCASFVSWVYKEAGAPFTKGYAGGWLHPLAAELKNWFENNKTYFKAGTQTPQPGDVVFWVGAEGIMTKPGHVGIVTSVSGSKFNDIEGNAASTILKNSNLNNTYGDSGLIGFGRM